MMMVIQEPDMRLVRVAHADIWLDRSAVCCVFDIVVSGFQVFASAITV